MKENIYTPPLTRTVIPPIEHLRTTPNYTQIDDEKRKQFFTNFNENLLNSFRRIRNN